MELLNSAILQTHFVFRLEINMYSKVITAGLFGIEGFKVMVETDISSGLPAFTVVGLPSATVKEARKE